MRHFFTRVGFLLGALLLGAQATTAQTGSQERQFADKLVHQVLKPQVRSVVVVFADRTHLSLAEEIALSIRSAGAFAIIDYASTDMVKRYFVRVPAQYDSQPQSDMLGLGRVADALVYIDAPADPSIVAGVPPSRLAAMANSANATTTYLLKKNVPQVDIGNGLMPSAATAQQFGVSEAVLSTVFWGGVNADYDRLRSDGASLSSALRASHRVHVSAANGSDFTFAVAPKGGQVNDGTVSAADRVRGGPAVDKQLPAGDVYVLPVAGSAKGTIVLGDFKFNGQLVSGLTLRFSNGTMTSMNAKSGLATIKKYYATGGADRDKFAWLDIGVNRTMHVPASRLWGAGPSMAAGYLTIGTGNNLFFGGSLHSPFAPTSNVPNATVMLDGKAIVTNGALAATP